MHEQPDAHSAPSKRHRGTRPPLREAEHLEPEARAQVADLLGNLAAELDQTEPSAQKEHLAQSAVQLVRAVKDQHEPGLIEAARERLEEAVARAEANCAGRDRPGPSTDRRAGQSGHLSRAAASGSSLRRSLIVSSIPDLLGFPHQLWLLGRAEADVRLGIEEQLVAGELQSDRGDERRFVEADLGRERVVRGPCAADRRRLLG